MLKRFKMWTENHRRPPIEIGLKQLIDKNLRKIDSKKSLRKVRIE